MAIENLKVIHDPKLHTASFDLKNRIVSLPILKEMNGYTYDAYIAHEIGHALYTPFDEVTKACKTIPHQFINITEDARIEKLVQRRYPGTVNDFYRFYKDVAVDKHDYFGIKALGIKDKVTPSHCSLIDRINLHFKIGTIIPVEFTDSEKKFVTMVDEAETFQDAVDAAKAIMDYMQHPPQKKSNNSSNNQSGGSGDDQEDQDADSGSNDQQDNEDQNSEGNSSNSQDDQNQEKDENQQSAASKKSSSDEEEGGKQNKSSKKSGTDTKSNNKTPQVSNSGEAGDPLKDAGQTQVSFEEAQKDLVEQNATGYVFGDIPNIGDNYKSRVMYLNDTMSNGSTFFDHIVRSSSNRKKYDEFIKEVMPTINMMVNQFNMKKAASDFQRTEISKTGALDMDQISNYKIQNDIFAKNEIVPTAKNHGMMMIIDWSSSMSSELPETVKQLIIMTEFCMKVGIPFEVYGFTTGSSYYSTKEKYNLLKGEVFATQEAEMFQLLSSNMKIAKYRELCAAVLDIVSSRSAHSIYAMGATPTTHTAFLSEYLVRDFKQKYNPEKMSLVVLTDGGANDSMAPGGHDYVMRNPMSNKNYEFRHTGTQYQDIFGYVRDKYKIDSLIGMYISSGFSTHLQTSLCPKPLKPIPTSMAAEFRSKNYTCFPKSQNFDKYFVISINNFKLDKTDYLANVSKETSENSMSKALEKEMLKKSKNMIFMKLFIDEIS